MSVNLDKFQIKNIKNQILVQGQPIQILEFRLKNGKKISREKMIKICDELKDDAVEQYGHGIISVSIRYPDRWYSGDVSDMDKDINYFSSNDYDVFDDDPEEYDAFRFQFIPQPGNAGGKDEHNDCLVNCIKKVVQTHKNELDPAKLKQLLGLERDDLIPTDKLKTVEKYIMQKTDHQYSIFVSGDHSFTSTLNSNKQIHLVLSKNHYSVDESKHKKSNRVAYEEKPILMFEFDDGTIHTFDGNKNGTISIEYLRENLKNVISSKKLLVEKNYCARVKNLTLEQSYHAYIKMANEMKDKTNGNINFFKCGTIKQTALNYFNYLSNSVQPENINPSESQFIEGASFQATTFWKTYKGSVHSYDINSHYPSIMEKNYHQFPIREGEYKIIETPKIDVKQPGEAKSGTPRYGIYRCTVDGSHPFFQHNKKNHYTHLDLSIAKELGFKITMIQDEKPNFLYYSDNKLMNGAFLFKHYINDFYKLKLEGVTGSKELLNILWGALSESKVYKYNVGTSDEVEINDAKLTHLNSYDDKINIKFINYKTKYYKTNWARIKPFVLGYGRYVLFKRFHKLAPDIVRIHTDGFYLTKNPELAIGVGIGHLKYEGEKMVDITGLNKLGQLKKAVEAPISGKDATDTFEFPDLEGLDYGLSSNDSNNRTESSEPNRVFTCLKCSVVNVCVCDAPIEQLYKIHNKYMCLDCYVCNKCQRL